jgi:hypothetical protein
LPLSRKDSFNHATDHCNASLNPVEKHFSNLE